MTVNGSVTDLPGAPTIDEVLSYLELPDRGVAVAINREVIARSAWSSRILTSGDSIEIVSAAAGG